MSNSIVGKLTMKWGLMFASLSLIYFSCTENPVPIIEVYIDPIIGKWDWIKSLTARGNYETNPLTEGYTELLNFKNDSIVELYRNDSLIKTNSYEFKYSINNPLDPNSDSTRYLIIYDWIVTRYSIINDTLILDMSYVDGPTIYYKKEY